MPRGTTGRVKWLPAAILAFRFEKCNIIPSIYGDPLTKNAVLLLPYYLCRCDKCKRGLIHLDYKIPSLFVWAKCFSHVPVNRAFYQMSEKGSQSALFTANLMLIATKGGIGSSSGVQPL